MKLTDLKNLDSKINKEAVYVEAGLNPVTMRSRISRGAPELSKAESMAIKKVLQGLIKIIRGVK